MLRQNYHAFVFAFYAAVMFFFCAPAGERTDISVSGSYEDLVTLFQEFREFHKPEVADGVPDYTAAAMKDQARGLKEFQRRLAAFDISDWTISQQVDYHIVRAEMNGLEFDHRVRRPWSRDPAFYLQSQRGAGPAYYGGVRVSDLPLSGDELEDVRMRLNAVPKIYEQAKVNLTEASGDFAAFAIHFLENEIRVYRNLSTRLAEYHPGLVTDAERAQAAVEEYGVWLEKNKSRMTAAAGLGKENYNWWMKNVQLFPYTWDELMVIAQHEYDRSIALLKLEQHRNRHLPNFKLITNEDEYHRLDNEHQRYLLQFIQENDIFTIPDYVKPVRDRPWAENPVRQFGTARDFFEQSKDRIPMHMRSHNFIGHALDGQRHHRDTRPIRGADRLYAMDMIRTEGLAFAMEGVLMHSGLYKDYPRGREINYISMVFRAVRSLTDLRLHSNEYNLEEGSRFFVDNTPYGWTLPDGREVWYETETTLRFPGWHTGMHTGKYQFLSIMADRANQRGDAFNLHEFMDEFFAAGSIPMSLIRWEMTGLDDEIQKLLQ